MTKKKEIELARKFFDLIFREVENGEDVIYDFIDPECRYKTLCDKLNNETVKEVLELGFKQKYGEEWHGGKGEQNNVDPLYDAKAVGNAAAMREALMHIQNLADALDLNEPNVIAILNTCRDALSAPPRNCDVLKTESKRRAAFIAYFNEAYDLKGSQYAIDTCDLKHDVDGILHDYIKWLFDAADESEVAK